MEILLLLLAIVFAVYGTMMYLTRSGVKFYFFWYFLSFLCFGLFLFFKFDYWARIPLIVIEFSAILFICLFLLFIYIESLIVRGFRFQAQKNLDAIIVLGAWVKKDGRPSQTLIYRLEAAEKYLKENPDTICVTTGGQGSNEPVSEAWCMANYLIQKGIASDRIYQDTESTNTKDNLLNASHYIQKDKATVAVITNNFHIYRAVKLAKKCGYKNVWGIPAKMAVTYLPNNMTREAFAIFKEWIFKNI